MDKQIETCPGCGCEPEKMALIQRHDRIMDTVEEIGYYDRCGARVERGALTGNGWL